MRYWFLSSLIIFALSACALQVNFITPAPTQTNVGFTPQQTATLPAPAITDILTATPSPPTTFELTSVITPSPTPHNLGVVPIQFASNGTYLDISDSIPAGASKTYSVSALKGQVMSVSISQNPQDDWVYTILHIVGADGTMICPPREDQLCQYWRGALPVTQDYLITLTPADAMNNFVMRVAINPPGWATQAFQYASQNQRVILTYTDEFAPTRFHGADVYKITPEFSLNYIDTASYFKTNLSEAYFLFGASSDANIIQTCTQPESLGGPESIVGDVNIHGIRFTKSQGGGVATGNIYEQTYYRAAHNDFCYEITFFVHYGNIGAYMPELGVKEFDRDALMKKFEAILYGLIVN